MNLFKRSLLGLSLLACILSFPPAANAQAAVTEATFDAAYWAAQPAAVGNLCKTSDQGARTASAITLANQGIVIDTQTDVWCWDPYLTMLYRQQMGYTWVPSLLQPGVAIAPGLPSQPGVPAYNPNAPPAGSIKVSLNVADYPPFNPPAAIVAATPPPNYVGPLQTGDIYSALAGDPTPAGTIVTTPAGKFQKYLVATPFGFNAYYLKVG